ncbi:hypothetical protein CcCBS67573_g01699 [Chytriomyces confervae]|uniref:GATA-type domain-containing protein n=1 Tax=Chytriomyces confervae TaxID=246404 RepID=A0A507FMV7_9FUNG|nr:hypothetical protein CcCBS67573_g01699 [Chytriomyces confervae]
MNHSYDDFKAQQFSVPLNNTSRISSGGQDGQFTSTEHLNNTDAFISPSKNQGAAAQTDATTTKSSQLNVNNSLYSNLTSVDSLANCFEGLDAKAANMKGIIPFHIPVSSSISTTAANRKRRGRKSKADVPDSVHDFGWKCVQCGAGEADTPLKRKGPDKIRNYCNACYVRWRVKVERSERGSARPIFSGSSVAPAAAAATQLRGLPMITPNRSSTTHPNFNNFRSNSSTPATLSKQSSLSLTSPTSLLGVPASLNTTLVPKSSPRGGNQKSSAEFWMQSPLYSTFDWNTGTSSVGDGFFPDFLRDVRTDSTLSMPSSRQSSTGQARPGLFSPSFDFGLSQASLLESPLPRRNSGGLGDLGISFDTSWMTSNPSFASSNHHQLHNTRSSNSSSGAQALPNLASLNSGTNYFPGNIQQPAPLPLVPSSLQQSKDWDLNQTQNDPTYLPVFDGSTADIEYNQILGYGAAVNDASTHDFLYGNEFQDLVAEGGFPGANDEGGQSSSCQGTGNQNQMYQYEPVSQFLLREGYDFDSSMT